MSAVSPFSEAKTYVATEFVTPGGVRMAAQFAPPADEYRAAREHVALFDRSDRGLFAATGAQRKAWLHNLVTSAVQALDDPRGQYAFALNVKGRIVFDLNIICLPDTLWLDLDLPVVTTAAAHFDRHLFAEDIKITDVTGQYARLGCSGPRAADIALDLGVAGFRNLAPLAHVALDDGAVRLVRHDFAGGPGFELVLPRGEAARWWERLTDAGAQPAGSRTLDLLRIEAGIPRLGRDIDDKVLPLETGQVERGVAFNKGCYLGHETIERMRSRGAPAQRLVQLRTVDGAGLELPAALRRDGIEVGRITSLASHPRESYWPGLGYLKTSVTGYADITTGNPPRAVTICSA